MRLTTQILDVSSGRPASDVCVRLYRNGPTGWCPVGEMRTDTAGRVDRWTSAQTSAQLVEGGYRLEFDAGRFYSTLGVVTTQTEVTISVAIRSGEDDYHVPVLLSPFGYSTYTGVER